MNQFQAEGCHNGCRYQTKWYKTVSNVYRYAKPKGRFCIIKRLAGAIDRPYDPKLYQVVHRSSDDYTEKAWFEYIG